MDEPTFDCFDVKFCRLIIEQLVQMRETIDAQSALLRTLAEQQDRIIDVLKAICDNVEGKDDPYGLFKDGRRSLGGSFRGAQPLCQCYSNALSGS